MEGCSLTSWHTESNPLTTQTANEETTPSTSEAIDRSIEWPTVFWITLAHFAVVLAPFTFSWSGLGLLGLLYWLTGGIGICLCYHRLLTHRSFQLVKPLEYLFTFFGNLATQGGELS